MPEGAVFSSPEVATATGDVGTAGDEAAPASGVPTTPVTVVTSGDKKTAPSGIFGLLAEVFEFRRKLHLLDNSLRLTDALADSSKTLRSPLVGRIRGFTQRSDELASQPPSQDPA